MATLFSKFNNKYVDTKVTRNRFTNNGDRSERMAQILFTHVIV